MHSVIEKVKSLVWLLRRPAFWPHMVELARRKFDGSFLHEVDRHSAEAWAAERASSIGEAMVKIGVLSAQTELPARLPAVLIREGEIRAMQSKFEMGGPGNLDLIYQSILAIKATRVVETGVAYGWSSLAALAALRQTGGRLVSVDMPYLKANNEAYVGIVVPDEWRDSWKLIREPDRNGIEKALENFTGEIDVAHFDSDKTYSGRMFAYPLLWNSLRSGGLFISDDIQDNFGFRDYCMNNGIDFAVTKSSGKYIGLAMKPLS